MALSAAGVDCFCGQCKYQPDDSLTLLVLEARLGEQHGRFHAERGYGGTMALLSSLILTKPLNLASQEKGQRILISHSISFGK
jgi:hypothetical protein